jgi:DNA-directed RNA polymerase subunit RPC12/RpoP
MALVACPECGRRISDTAAACIGCGRPMSSRPPFLQHGGEPPVAGTELPDKPATWRCTNCGATAFRKYSIVYDEQRSSARFHVSGGGIAVSSEGPGVAVGSASGRSVQETKLSSRVAPPVAPPRPYGGPGCSAMLLAVVIPPSLFGRKNWQPRRTRALPDEEVRYRARLDRWNRSYLCVNCGATRLLPETKQ